MFTGSRELMVDAFAFAVLVAETECRLRVWADMAMVGEASEAIERNRTAAEGLGIPVHSPDELVFRLHELDDAGHYDLVVGPVR